MRVRASERTTGGKRGRRSILFSLIAILFASALKFACTGMEWWRLDITDIWIPIVGGISPFLIFYVIDLMTVSHEAYESKAAAVIAGKSLAETEATGYRQAIADQSAKMAEIVARRQCDAQIGGVLSKAKTTAIDICNRSRRHVDGHGSETWEDLRDAAFKWFDDTSADLGKKDPNAKTVFNPDEEFEASERKPFFVDGKQPSVFDYVTTRKDRLESVMKLLCGQQQATDKT